MAPATALRSMGKTVNAALDSLLRETKIGHGGDVLGGVALAIVEPEDGPVALSFSGGKTLVELIKERGLFNGGGRGGLFDVRAVVFDLAATFLSGACAEVIERNGGGDDLKVAKDRLVVAGLEIAETAAVSLQRRR